MISRIISNLPMLHELTMQSVLRSYNRPLPPGSISVPISPPRAPSGRYLATSMQPLKVAMRKGFWECVREAEAELQVSLVGGPRDFDGMAQRGFTSQKTVHVEWRA